MSARAARESAPRVEHALDLIYDSNRYLKSLIQAIDYCVEGRDEYGDGVPTDVILDCLGIALKLSNEISAAAGDLCDALDRREA